MICMVFRFHVVDISSRIQIYIYIYQRCTPKNRIDPYHLILGWTMVWKSPNDEHNIKNMRSFDSFSLSCIEDTKHATHPIVFRHILKPARYSQVPNLPINTSRFMAMPNEENEGTTHLVVS